MKKILMYFKSQRAILHPQFLTKAGFWIQSEPIFVLNHDDWDTIMEKLFECFSINFSETDTISSWKDLQKKLLKSFNVKSLKDFHEGTLCLSIEKKGSIVIFTPMKNLGHKEGFDEIIKAAVISSEDYDLLKLKLQDALSKCT
jgi:hypothetical protein